MNSTLAAIGIEYLANEINVVVAHWSMARLEALSMHPILSKNVKSIDISCLIEGKRPSEQDFAQYLGGMQRYTTIDSKALVRSAFEEHSNFCYGH